MNTQADSHHRSDEFAAAPQTARAKARVLLVDDDETLLTALRRRLQDHFDVRLATSARDALALMHTQGPFGVIVTDMTMPGMDGATLLGEVKRFFPQTVRLMLTGHGNAEVVNRAVNECGVFRFLSKPCTPADFDRALEDAVELHAQWHAGGGTDAWPVAVAQVAHLLPRRFDPTTGLASRHAFEAETLAVLAEADASDPASVLVHLDIDNFRLINEACGFAAGDALLQHLARHVTRVLGADVPMARLSADEFGVLLRGESARNVEETCERMLDAFAGAHFSWDGELMPVSVCAGAVPLSAEIQGISSWLLLAETACGVAKQLGTGRIHVGRLNDPALARRQDERQWLSRIQRALEGNKFRLMFQRIVPLQGADDGRPHFELLLRMEHESGSLLSPQFFMPIAERYHLSGALDRWVVRNAFQWLAADRARLERIALCSINLSGGSVCDPQFLAFLLEMQESCRVPPGKVCLEITETAAVSEIVAAGQIIRNLRGIGFHFALDDFGSGLCSFAYLKHLPVDYLKIDGCFVRQLASDPISRAMVQSINQIGQVTGKKTVAEFVENEAIANVLRRIGVDFGQGYGIHRPSPLESL